MTAPIPIGRRPPRVWVLTSVHGPRDVRIFHRQACSLAEAGYEVTLVAPGAPQGELDGVRFERLPAWGGRAGRPFRWPVLLLKAARARADAYHIHDPELLPWGLLLERLTGRPVIYDSHEYLAEAILGKRWIPRPLRRPVSRWADVIEKGLARRLSAVVTVTDEMADRFRPVQPRTVVVRNLPRSTDAARAPDPPPVIIHSGLMDAERGLGLLYATAVAVRRRRPDAEIHILGPVDWADLPRDRDRPPETWAGSGVVFLGTVPQAEVVVRLAEASIGWLPRDPMLENARLAWPNKLGEYMIVGLPVVASDLPVQARIIREARCGLVVGPYTAEAHAGALLSVLDDPVEAREMGERGRRVARELLTWDSQARILLDLYAELVPSGSVRPAP